MRGLRHCTRYHDVVNETRKLLADDSRSLETDLSTGEKDVSSPMRCDATAVLDHALWHQQPVYNVDDTIGRTVVLVDERDAVNEELSSLRSDSKNFAVKRCQCSTILKSSAELQAGNDVMRNDALHKLVVR